MEHGFARTYGVELLIEQPPYIDRDLLWAQLRQHSGQVDALHQPEHSDLLLFAHLDYPVHYADGTVPAQTFIAVADKPTTIADLTPALQQSWTWPDAHETVAKCRSTILVSDLMASGLAYKNRLRLFHTVLVSVLDVVPCLAIHWRPSQQIIQPEMYRQTWRSEQPDLLYAALNIRLFNIEGRGLGETLMDSLGLAALGVPDVQCHFVNLDPNDVARVLTNAAYYLFERGDVINDGETIQGLTAHERWRCQHEEALVAPERVVLDLNPGKRYAAGNRT